MKVLSSGIEADVGSSPRNPVLAGTETILLVEDDAMIRDLLTAAVESYGYAVLAAEDGEAAIDVAAAHAAPIHLVISDVIMPRMDGRQLVERLRRWYPSIGVLLMSGYELGAKTALDVENDLTFFIQKPFSIEALAAAVRSAIEWRPHHRP
jgi:CheY-like chemotaxis protein